MVVAKFFPHGQNPQSLIKIHLGEKWLLQNSSIIDKIHDHSKFLPIRELEILEKMAMYWKFLLHGRKKCQVLAIPPSWKNKWLSVGNFLLHLEENVANFRKI